MKQTILIMILFLFSNVLPFFSCLSCFDTTLLPLSLVLLLLGKVKAHSSNVQHTLVYYA